jgi:molybdate transport system substrate-binding protein
MGVAPTLVTSRMVVSSTPRELLLRTSKFTAKHFFRNALANGSCNRSRLGFACGALRVPIGIAVRLGATKPDISSVEAIKRTLRGAKSIAYLKAGISGPYLDRLFDTWGMAEELQPKSKRTETDTVGELVAQGEAEIGVTAIATLIATPGIEVVGPIPNEIQSYVSFQGAVSANAGVPDVAAELVRFVTGPNAVSIIKSKGMEPWQ